MRIIDDIGLDAFTNMAVDETIFQGFLKGESPPTLRFYTFSPPAITLGYLQRMEEVDLENCRRMGIQVVRRPTGGRAVIHEGDLTFSLVGGVDDPLFGGSLLETYRKVSEVFRVVFEKMGIEAKLVKSKVGVGLKPAPTLCFSSTSRYELLVKGEKVMGCAQVRKGGSFLLQGSLRVEETERNYHTLFRGNGSVLPKSISSIQGTNLRAGRIKELVEGGLGKGWKKGRLTEREEEELRGLRRRYLSHDWNCKY